jgi:hypothetical protein
VSHSAQYFKRKCANLWIAQESGREGKIRASMHEKMRPFRKESGGVYGRNYPLRPDDEGPSSMVYEGCPNQNPNLDMSLDIQSIKTKLL